MIFTESRNAIKDEQMNISDLDVALNSPIAPSRLSSTPIRKIVEQCDESPDQDYRGSPTSLYPCTQESGSEITWDWDGKASKKRDNSAAGCSSTNRQNGGLNNTPKRPHLLHKKRLAKSNSPLLNIPPKRKLVNLDVAAEHLGKFAKELEALADEIKTGLNERNEEKRNEEVATTSANTMNIFEMPTQKILDIHEVDTMEFEDKNDAEKPESSLDDMFDDLDEACMVQCSQEVEDKLKSEVQCSRINSGPRIDEKNKTEIPKSRDVKNETQIPDDSFDDCLAFCSDDDDLMGMFLAKEKVDSFDRLKNATVLNSAVSDKTNSWQVSSAFDANSNLKRKQQFGASEGLSTAAQNRKFFKEKSLSDSVFNKSGVGKAGKPIVTSNTYNKHPAPIAKSTSVYNMSSQSKSNGSVPAAVCRNNQPFNYNGSQQPQMNKNASWSYRRNSGGSSAAANTTLQPRCTPAEIEKKRQEARMKLEANRKKKFNLSLSGRSNVQTGVQRPGVKR